MKICIMNNLLKPYNRGGAGQVAHNIALGLEDSGNKIFFISTKPIFSNAKSKNNTYYINSFFYNLNKIPKIFRLFWHFFDMFSIRKYLIVKSILKKENPEIIITHNLKGIGFLTPRLIKKMKIKHVHYLHDIQLIHPSGLILYDQEEKIKTSLAKFYQKINLILFNSPDIIISPSSWLINLYNQYNFFPKSKKVIFPNPIVENSDSKRTQKENDKITFLYVGELEKHKGIIFLIQSFIKLDNNFQLYIIGKGSEEGAIKNLIKNTNGIFLLGWQDNQKVKEYMSKSDVLIMPSYCYENSPTVIYEAVTAGLPVIASNIGGNPELVNKFSGLLFEPENEEDFIGQIKYAINNIEIIKAQAYKARENIKQYNIYNYTKNLLSIIQNLY